MGIIRYISAGVLLFFALIPSLTYTVSLGILYNNGEAENQGVSLAEIKLVDRDSETVDNTPSDIKPSKSAHAPEEIHPREGINRQYQDIFNSSDFPGILTSGVFAGDRSARQPEISEMVNSTEHQEREKRQAAVPERMYWPDAVVPWRYDMGRRRFRDPKSHPEIDKGMKFWSDNTCVKFVPYDDAQHLDFLEIGLGPGCSSVLGYSRRGGQYLSLSERGCVVFGTITHEIGHSLGLFHEQCREDRDEYVDIIWENVRSRYTFNFDMRPVQLLGHYDLGSIMHYGPKAFSANRKTTVEAKDHRLQFLIGQRDAPSFYDIMAINNMYRCAKKNCPTLITCHHGGYQDHTCSCRCPDGLAGKNCEHVDSDETVMCGGLIELNATSREVKITPPSTGLFNSPDICVWVVKSPWFTKMNAELEIPAEIGYRTFPICRHWLEVRYQLIGQKGVRNCLDSPLTDNYDTLTNLMLIKLHTSGGFSRLSSGFEMTVHISTKDICSKNPCDNSGVCRSDAELLFTCECAEGYSGETCEQIQGQVRCGFHENDRFRYGDSNKICFLTQSREDDFDWEITDQSTPSAGTGPMGGADSYLYVEATDQLVGHVARLAVDGISGGTKCLSLNLHMYGSQMGTLEIGLIYDNQKLDKFTITGNQGQRWKILRINLLCPYTFTLEIEGIVGSGYKSDMALDNLSIVTGECDSANYTLRIADFAGPEQFFCDFSLDSCGFVQADSNNGRFKWKSGSGSTKSRMTGPQQIRGDAFFYAEASEPAMYGDTARLASPTFYNQGPYCLTFWYYAYGSGLGAFSVLVQDYELEWEELIWSTVGQIRTDFGWNNLSLEINVVEKIRVVFQSKRGENYRGDYAIQDVSVIPQACHPKEKVDKFPFTCNFNSLDMCGMLNLATTDTTRPWLLAPPRTTRLDTRGDTGSALVILLWIFPIGRMSSAVTTPVFKVTGSACLEFWYHMTCYDSGLNSLLVYATEIREGSTETMMSWPIWFGDQPTKEWTKVQIDIEHNGKLRLEFEAAVGMWWISASIDDLKFTPGTCT